MSYAKPVAWRVELNGWTGICFAVSASKAKWTAVKSYWEAFGRRKGEWPRPTAARAKAHDESAMNTERNKGRMFGEEYV